MSRESEVQRADWWALRAGVTKGELIRLVKAIEAAGTPGGLIVALERAKATLKQLEIERQARHHRVVGAILNQSGAGEKEVKQC